MVYYFHIEAQALLSTMQMSFFFFSSPTLFPNLLIHPTFSDSKTALCNDHLGEQIQNQYFP